MGRKTTAQAQAEVRLAAGEVLADRGVLGFTVDAVAERSGVAKTTIYRHWPSAHHLLLDTMAAQVRELPTPNTGSLRGDLHEFFATLLDTVDTKGLRPIILDMLAVSSRDPDMDRIRSDMLVADLHPLRTVLELAQLRGELEADIDLELAMDVVHGSLFHRRIVRGVEVSEPQLGQLVDAAVGALRAW